MSEGPIRFGVFGSADDAESFASGQVVFRAGESGDRLYVVRSGAVELRHGDIVLERLGPGEMFGEMAIIDGSPRSATAVACEDSELVPIDQPRFHALCQHTPFFAENVMRLIAGRLRRTTQSL